VHLLAERAIDDGVIEDLIREMAWYDDYLGRGGADRSANTTPGNKKGGLANIVEKALGSTIKSGTTPLMQVVGPGERPSRKGLIFAATPASDFVCGTEQLASGITLQVFTTGRGTPYALSAAPVLKVATNSTLAERWHDLIDFDAGGIATGAKTIEATGWEMFHLILETASGRNRPWADRWGITNALAVFNPAPVT
jgi:galactarate dehydratase